jgi:hypothetical protein
LTGKTFARHWIHNGMLQIQTKLDDGTYKLEKMSKSLGNVVTIREFLADHPADAFAVGGVVELLPQSVGIWYRYRGRPRAQTRPHPWSAEA